MRVRNEDAIGNAEILEKLQTGYMLYAHYGRCWLFLGDIDKPASKLAVTRSQIKHLESKGVVALVSKRFNLKVWRLNNT